jgi:hypothetical protein
MPLRMSRYDDHSVNGVCKMRRIPCVPCNNNKLGVTDWNILRFRNRFACARSSSREDQHVIHPRFLPQSSLMEYWGRVCCTSRNINLDCRYNHHPSHVSAIFTLLVPLFVVVVTVAATKSKMRDSRLYSCLVPATVYRTLTPRRFRRQRCHGDTR